MTMLLYLKVTKRKISMATLSLVQRVFVGMETHKAIQNNKKIVW